MVDAHVPPNCFEHPIWLKRFVDDLEDPQWAFLHECGLNLLDYVLHRPLNVTILDAATSHWNPGTNIFFKVCEMTILLEEVDALMKIKGTEGSARPGKSRTTLLESRGNLDIALRGILKNDADFDVVTKNDELNLELL